MKSGAYDAFEVEQDFIAQYPNSENFGLLCGSFLAECSVFFSIYSVWATVPWIKIFMLCAIENFRG